MFGRNWQTGTGTIVGSEVLTDGFVVNGAYPHDLVVDVQPADGGAAFRARFIAKGTHRALMEAIPVRLILDPLAAFRGLLSLFDGAR